MEGLLNEVLFKLKCDVTSSYEPKNKWLPGWKHKSQPPAWENKMGFLEAVESLDLMRQRRSINAKMTRATEYDRPTNDSIEKRKWHESIAEQAEAHCMQTNKKHTPCQPDYRCLQSAVVMQAAGGSQDETK